MNALHGGSRWNWTRLLLGGTCAGLAFNVGGMASALLLELPATFARFGVEASAGTAILHAGLRMGLGFASVVAYVAVRGSLGPGPSTSAGVGLLVWFVGYVPGSTVLLELGVLSGGQFGLGLVWGMAEAVAATSLGAWLYRPPEA